MQNSKNSFENFWRNCNKAEAACAREFKDKFPPGSPGQKRPTGNFLIFETERKKLSCQVKKDLCIVKVSFGVVESS